LLQQIDALLQDGTGPTAVAKITGLSKDRISRHKRHSGFQPAPAGGVAGDPVDELAASDERLARWLERSESVYVASAASGDLRSLVEVMRSGIRAELETRRRAEARAEQLAAAAETKKTWQIEPEFADDIMRRFDQMIAANSLIRCQCCDGLGYATAERNMKGVPNVHTN
jgi:hypothetical protein